MALSTNRSIITEEEKDPESDNTQKVASDEYKTITCCKCGCCRCCIAVYKVISIIMLYLLDIIITLLILLYSILFRIPHCCISQCLCCCNGKNVKEKEIIVIIGYSFAGLEIHKLLQTNSSLKHYEFIIIEPKSYIEYTPSILRSIVNPKRYKSIAFPLNKCFDSKHSKLICAKAISISSNSVSIQMLHDQSMKTIGFDYCFICTGSKYASPIKTDANITDNMQFSNREKQLKDVHSTLTNANSIGIIGGGPVGVELMGEIMEQYPHKVLTIIDRNASLCYPFPQLTRTYLEEWVEKHANVTLKLNTQITNIVDNPSNYEVHIEDKDNEECVLVFDIIFQCNGFKPNSELLLSQDSEDDFKHCLHDKYKSILVDDWLRVCGKKHIFASGDVMKLNKMNEVKLAYTAEVNARYLADLMEHMNSNKTDEFKPYHEWLFGERKAKNGSKYEMPMMFTISLGSWDGAMGYFDILLTGCFSQIMKWFIEWSLCKCWQRAPLFRIECNDYTIFEMHAIGYTVCDVIWKVSHYLASKKMK